MTGLVLSTMVFLLSFVTKKHEWLLRPLAYVACFIYYSYGIFLGTITEPEGKTVTFMVMLVLMPILFIDKPTRLIGMTVVYDTIFITLCLSNKSGFVQRIDIIDAVLFGILGIAAGMVINQMKVKSYINERKLQEVSRVDQLTGVDNRNAYELDLFSIPEKCRHNLACVYIDVNGLHELNNTEGHKFGDEMLKFVATKLREAFPNGFVYRVGGDEFIVFIPDMSMADVSYVIKALIRKVEDAGYYIAVGYETMGARYLVVDELIDAAEMRMSMDKERFYRERPDFSRR